MKKLLIFLFSILISFNSYGEWTEINYEYTQTEEGETYYVDKDTITKQDGYVYWWMLVDEPLMPFSEDMSIKAYIQGDCGVNRVKLLAYNYYKQPMGIALDKTVTVGNIEWIYPPLDTVASTILSRVCSIVSP